MRIVIALGGNALLERGDKPDPAIQLANLRNAAEAIAPFAADHSVLTCHGNGPQVGMLSLESETDHALTRPYPLDDLVAQTQGMIGYWLAQALRNAGVKKPVLSLITQTLVDAADPAFAAPTKFVGPAYRRDRAQLLANRHGWTIAADNGQWRRVVASPDPLRIVEQDSIAVLLDAGSVVVCGGGGAAVTENTAGQLSGVDAVVDKDYVASLLGILLGAQHLLVLTDVSAVMEHYGTPQATPLTTLDPDDLGSMGFPAGSMGPKIEACRRFVIATGRPATIGALADAQALLAGTAGTTITPTTRPHEGTHQGVGSRRGPNSARTQGPQTLMPSAGVFQD
jgi:carbamate kinase